MHRKVFDKQEPLKSESMELFSQRQGIKPVKNIMQVNSTDAELRNKLWNAVGFCYWNQIGTYQFPELHYEIPTFINNLLDRLWHEYFKRPLDTMPFVIG